MKLFEKLIMWSLIAALSISVFLLNQKLDNISNQANFNDQMLLMKITQHELIMDKLHATDTLLYNRFLKLEQE